MAPWSGHRTLLIGPGPIELFPGPKRERRARSKIAPLAHYFLLFYFLCSFTIGQRPGSNGQWYPRRSMWAGVHHLPSFQRVFLHVVILYSSFSRG